MKVVLALEGLKISILDQITLKLTIRIPSKSVVRSYLFIFMRESMAFIDTLTDVSIVPETLAHGYSFLLFLPFSDDRMV